MPEIQEVKITRVLNPTSIDLGEFVINPFMGCEFSCLYCYVRSNRVVSKRNKPWGEFIDVRINSLELLEEELQLKRPKQVLLGSTTECFQPVEKQYGITKGILEILNKHKVNYVILTRSPFIVEYIDLLNKGFCKRIYFTINDYLPELKLLLEPRSPDFSKREEAINYLVKNELDVVAYFSPVIPWISNYKDVFSKFPLVKQIDFECLNFNLQNIKDILDNIIRFYPQLMQDYKKLVSDKDFYDQVWKGIIDEISNLATGNKKVFNIYTHQYGDFFKNSYGKI